MSLFGTLGRIKKKKSADPTFPAKVKDPVFNSTPNLCKIDSDIGVSQQNILDKYANNPSSKCKTKKRRDSSAGFQAVRPFVSVVSLVSNIKRATSRRKLAFGSAMHLSNEKDDRGLDSLQVPTGKVDSRSDDTVWATAGSTLSLPRRKTGKRKNLEPGVVSSSSSEDSESISFRNSAEQSDNVSGDDVTAEAKFEKEQRVKRATLMLQGAKKFNMDQKKGIEFLIQNNVIQHTPEDVAGFLKDGEGLSKMAIGNYLGEKIDFNEEVLRAFVDLHDFTNVLLVQALRQFLWSFRLPGEAQKIDRMMEAFAKRYCQLNPGIFTSTDGCYLICFAVIMLNTSLHNPNVKNKPTVEQFVRMNRDVAGGQPLNTDFIKSLYNSILAEPFKIPPEDGNDLMLTFFNPDIEGWLWKQGGRYKNWKRRWFILSNNCLYYFKFTTDKKPRGIIPLENIHATLPAERVSAKYAFSFMLSKTSLDTKHQINDYIKTCKTLSNGEIVAGHHTFILLAASNGSEREKWVKAINNNSSLDNFYSELSTKKRNLELRRRLQSTNASLSFSTRSLPTTTMKTPTVRKSQISLPSTLGVDSALDYEIHSVRPDKNPHNYFAAHKKPPCHDDDESEESLSTKDSSYDSSSLDTSINSAKGLDQIDMSKLTLKDRLSLYFEATVENLLESGSDCNSSFSPTTPRSQASNTPSSSADVTFDYDVPQPENSSYPNNRLSTIQERNSMQILDQNSIPYFDSVYSDDSQTENNTSSVLFNPQPPSPPYPIVTSSPIVGPIHTIKSPEVSMNSFLSCANESSDSTNSTRFHSALEDHMLPLKTSIAMSESLLSDMEGLILKGDNNGNLQVPVSTSKTIR